MPDALPTPTLPATTEPDDPLANDTAFAAWPAEVRTAWAQLKLPSLQELLIGQERLAAEIRRQNQELRRLAQSQTQPPPSTVDTEAMARAMSEARTLGERLATAASAGLIALAESADRHALALDTAVRALIARPVGRDWLGRARPWPEDARLSLQGQVDGARLVRDKARQALADAGMRRIAPQPGESFDPDIHHCSGSMPGPSGRVLRCEREGWRIGATLLRPAEVIIGSTTPSTGALP